MNFLAYGLIALALIGAVGGLYGTVHHSGVAEGRAEVQALWDKASKKAQDRADQNRETAKAIADKSASNLAALQYKATTFEAKWRAERAKQSDSTLAGCQGPTTMLSGASGSVVPSPTPVRFSAGFLRLWDGAWTGDEGKPVFGDSSTPSGQPADTSDALTGIGPGEVLDNHALNAEACSVDRRKLDSLIGQIEKLRAGWH